jgi:mono/diheme cytochrome c family protein
MKQRIMIAMLCLGILASATSWAADPEFSWQAPPEAGARKNPVAADSASLQRGKAVYNDNCQMCHGDTGKGDGPMADTLTKHPGDLSAERMHKLTDGDLFWRISTGDEVMPSFEKEKPLTEQRRWDVIHYIRTLANKKGR